MLKFVTQKMWNKKWIMLCLLIGNIFLISIACCNPLYTDAIQKKTLANSMSEYITENNRYPGTIVVDAAITVVKGEHNADKFTEAIGYVEDIKKDMGVKIKENVEHLYLPNIPGVTESKYGDSVKEVKLSIGAITNLEEHVKIVSGKMFSNKEENGVVEALISEKGLVSQKLLVGETLEFDAIRDEKNKPLKVRIVGVFANSDENDVFWVNSPNSFTSEVLISKDIFKERYEDYENLRYGIRGAWHILLDYNDMQESQLTTILEKTQKYKNLFKEDSAYTFRAYYEDLLEEHVKDRRMVQATLLVLQVPILMLLAAFIFMVSRQILEIEQNEISILKSRGASKKQILITYLIQSAIIAGIAVIIGLPFGAFLCQVLGSADSFLGFVSRRALSLHFSVKVLIYALAAVVFSIGTMILPVFKFADLTIVEQKQKKDLKKKTVWWQRYYIDVLCLLVSLYGLYAFHSQKGALAKKVAEGASLDPLLFLSSSLFLLGASLVALRVIPLILNLIFKSGKNKWSPSVYASFLRVLRTRNKQQFIMVFLMITLSLGIFNAYAARTINTNAQDKIRYTNGADVVLMEQWGEEEEEEKKEKSSTDLPEDVEEREQFPDMPEMENEEAAETETDITEPDFEKFQLIEGVEHVTKVYMDEAATVPVAAKESGVDTQQITIMGINTKGLGETGWFKDGLLQKHWYYYLNAISKNSSAILVSQNFKTVLGYNIGDVITYTTGKGNAVRGVIYGFVEYWPGYNSVQLTVNADGSETEGDRFMIVANLSKIQAVDGVLPYYVWLDVKGSTQPVYDFIGDNKMKLDYFTDSYADILSLKNEPVIQGTNGILTVSFIVVLLLCGVGFLIFWVLSIRSRALQFGIFRAMGMSMKEILIMLFGEQLFITGSSLIAGVLIGLAGSYLYIPLIQIAYGSADSVIPLSIEPAVSDLVKIFVVVAIIIGVCMVVLGNIIKDIKISQALKLGED